jgi:hypothetical protein
VIRWILRALSLPRIWPDGAVAAPEHVVVVTIRHDGRTIVWTGDGRKPLDEASIGHAAVALAHYLAGELEDVVGGPVWSTGEDG